MTTTPSCPITGEPLLNPGQTISHTAMRRAQTQTRGLTTLMRQVTAALSATPTDTTGARTQPASRPPLNLTLLDRIDPHRDTLNAWAYHLLTHRRPGTPFHDGNWQQIETIYQQLLPQTLHWAEAPAMVDEILDALHQIERALTPPTTPKLSEGERAYAAGELIDMHLTITPAIEAVRLTTGVKLPKNTVYSWVRRGKIQARGEPKRYLIRDLLDLLSQ